MSEFPVLASYDLSAAASVANIKTNGDFLAVAFDMLVTNCHAASYNRGWWHDPITGLSLIPDDNKAVAEGYRHEMIKAWFPFVIATKIALIHSETSEGLEAYRIDAVDDKIPFPGIVAEMADVVIRVADLMGCLKYARAEGIILDGVIDGQVVRLADNAFDLGAAFMAKMPFNVARPDHDLSKRAAVGGKKF